MTAPRHIHIDLETYSDVDIKKSGLYKYVQSPAFEMLLFAYSADEKPVIVIDLACGEQIPPQVLDWLWNPQVEKRAFNAAFEWYCLSEWAVRSRLAVMQREQWIPQWRCTQLHAAYLGYPFALDAVGKALRLPEKLQKDRQGSMLIQYFCVPCKPTARNGGRTRNYPKHDPDKWALFKRYNAQDVVTEMEVTRRLSGFPIPSAIQTQWEQDLRINARGVGLDTDLATGALDIKLETECNIHKEIIALTGVTNPNSLPQLKAWLEIKLGRAVPVLDKAAAAELADSCDDPDVLTLLELRKLSGKTSLAKYQAMLATVCTDGRIRGSLRFYGANRTGRWSGQHAQLQNLPRTYLKAIPVARQWTKERKADQLRMAYGSVAGALSQLIRTAFVPAPGCKFVDADFSAIEARVLAWLAEEEWVLEVFRTHGRIYEACASQMFGVPLDAVDKNLRQKGKVATLALGYGGSDGALRKMGAVRDGIPEVDLPDIVRRWRSANKCIVSFWYTAEQAAKQAIETGRQTAAGNILFAREVDHKNNIDTLTVQLPSGRKLHYPEPRIAVSAWNKPAIHYSAVSGKSWTTEETYYGKLTENITQAVARDCLAHGMAALETAGYNIVFHVHDEVIIEASATQADTAMDDVCRILSQPIPWANGLPMNAEGWVGDFYKKD